MPSPASSTLAWLARHRYLILLSCVYSAAATYFLYGFYASHASNDGIIFVSILAMPLGLLLYPFISPELSIHSQAAAFALCGLLQSGGIGCLLDWYAMRRLVKGKP